METGRGAEWECEGKYQDGTESSWLYETLVLDRITPLNLDINHALWDLYHRQGSGCQSPPSMKLRRLHLAQVLFPLSSRGSKWFGDWEFDGQVHDHLDIADGESGIERPTEKSLHIVR